jgi:enoyl-CoA hydratase
MNTPVDVEISDGIARLTLNSGKVNELSMETFDALNAALDQAAALGAVVILTGQPGVFSGGYDLKVMRSGPEAAADLVTAGSSFSRRLLSHPHPVIAACSGHAIANGAFILLSTDYRLGVDGDFKIGLNETAIGMTMHQVGIELARARLTPSAFNRAVLNAEMFGPTAAVAAGFLDRVVSVDALTDASTEVAKEMLKLNLVAHRHTKLKARKPLLDALDAAIKNDHGQILMGSEFR